MKIKVCGIRNERNLSFLSASEVDYVGFIFYQKSARNYSEGDLSPVDLGGFTKQKVGVFVNENPQVIAETVKRYALDYIQLHGDESPAYCEELKSMGFKLFKAFAVKDELPALLSDYEPFVDFFLFDTKGKAYGGNGVQFDWSVLRGYGGHVPFILSGGIGPEDVASLKKLDHPKLHAVDVNSRFELAPGDKDNDRLKEFISELKKQA